MPIISGFLNGIIDIDLYFRGFLLFSFGRHLIEFTISFGIHNAYEDRDKGGKIRYNFPVGMTSVHAKRSSSWI
jgi:hypothetical protein